MNPSAIAQHFLPVVQTLGIMGSLVLSAWAAWRQHRSQQINTLVRITGSHREIWSRLFERPSLARVSDPNADIREKRISLEERLFVLLLALHLQAVFEAERSGTLRPIWGLDRDVATFFSAPIPKKVWADLREYQDPRFRSFVDSLIQGRVPPLHGSRAQ